MNEENNTKLIEVKNKESFAKGYNFYKIFLIFMVGCFLGDLWEIFLHFIKNGELVATRRGVIYGPFNPVYGFGVALMVIFLIRIKDTKKLFIYGSIIGGVFEYICSFVQEKVFGSMSWDYSGYFLNIDGRTTIPYAMFWGLLCVILLKYVIPHISNLIEKIPNEVGKPLTILLVIFMVFNISISALASNRNLERYKNIPANGPLDNFLDTMYPDEKMREVYQNFDFIDK